MDWTQGVRRDLFIFSHYTMYATFWDSDGNETGNVRYSHYWYVFI